MLGSGSLGLDHELVLLQVRDIRLKRLMCMRPGAFLLLEQGQLQQFRSTGVCRLMNP